MKIPRKNSRQWHTAIRLVKAHKKDPQGWVDDAGYGHAELIDDVSRLRQKGWEVDDKGNADLLSRSYRLNAKFWNSVKDTIDPFWE